jgi:hypothetical protein
MVRNLPWSKTLSSRLHYRPSYPTPYTRANQIYHCRSVSLQRLRPVCAINVSSLSTCGSFNAPKPTLQPPVLQRGTEPNPKRSLYMLDRNGSDSHVVSYAIRNAHDGQTLYVTTRITMYVHLLPCAVYTALISTESLRSVTQQTPKERERRNQVSPKGSKYPSSADLKCPCNATRLLLNGEKKKRTRPTQPAPCFV